MAHPKRFSESVEMEIARRYESGDSTCKLSKAYGATTSRIGIILKRRGVAIRSQRRYSEEQAAEIVRMYNAGASTTVIADTLGVKHPTIANALKYAGVQLRDRVELARERTGAKHPNYTTGQRAGETYYKREAPQVLPDRCERCGKGEDLVVHHRNGNHTDNRPSNWERLCRPCHAAHHKFWEEKQCA